MFPKSKEKYPNQEEFILRQIYNYYSNNYISLSKINNSIELIFNLKIESSEEVITISIELNKINKKLKYEDLFNIFNKKINQLNKELEDMKFNYKINLEKKEEEINALNRRIKENENEFNKKLEEKEKEVNIKIEEMETKFNKKIEEKEKEINEIKRN